MAPHVPLSPGPPWHVATGENVQMRPQTHLPIRTYTTTVRRMMATAAEMAISTTWLFSLEMEKAAKATQKHVNNLTHTHISLVTSEFTCT